MVYPTWKEAVEAAISSGRLQVTGEVRGGQLVQFSDPSGAIINILAVEPFATWAGYAAGTEITGHVDMLNDVVGLIQVVDDSNPERVVDIATITANIAQGPLLVEEDRQMYQQVSLSALELDSEVFDSVDDYLKAKGGAVGLLTSHGAARIAAADGSTAPDASATIIAAVRAVHRRINTLTDQAFTEVELDLPFPLVATLATDADSVHEGSVVAGSFILYGSVNAPVGCGDGGGCGGGGCACGSGGCGNH